METAGKVDTSCAYSLSFGILYATSALLLKVVGMQLQSSAGDAVIPGNAMVLCWQMQSATKPEKKNQTKPTHRIPSSNEILNANLKACGVVRFIIAFLGSCHVSVRWFITECDFWWTRDRVGGTLWVVWGGGIVKVGQPNPVTPECLGYKIEIAVKLRGYSYALFANRTSTTLLFDRTEVNTICYRSALKVHLMIHRNNICCLGHCIFMTPCCRAYEVPGVQGSISHASL